MDPNKAFELVFKVVADMAGAFTMGAGYIGDKLGLFKALAAGGPQTSEELAERTGLDERYVREWARGMVAAEYIDFDPQAGRFRMSPEQAAVFADESFPGFVGGALQFTLPSLLNAPRLLDCYRSGGGLSYETLGEDVPCGIERFFGPGYRNHLAQDWIPAVDGLEAKLRAGIRVADVGCGCGQSSRALARAYPASQIVGIDFHAPSVARARAQASEEALSNVEFRQGPAHEHLAGERFDLVCAFDCIHDMVDPQGTLKAIRSTLSDDGLCFWIEPNASSSPHENRNPVGKAFSNISTFHCMTVSLAHGGAGLGTVLGLDGAQRLAKEAGFSRCERVALDHPFNMFLAARP